MLNENDWKILKSLDGYGGCGTDYVRNNCDAFSNRNQRMRASKIRQCLLHMQKEALVEHMDNEKPVMWQITDKGREALKTRDSGV